MVDVMEFAAIFSFGQFWAWRVGWVYIDGFIDIGCGICGGSFEIGGGGWIGWNIQNVLGWLGIWTGY